ncbi:MAG: hypothetical protein AB7G13_24715 [Lautropia sp.]
MNSSRLPESAVYVLEKMAHGYKRLGRSSGAGFYDYNEDGTRTLWSGLKSFERRGRSAPTEDIRDRLFYIQALETFRCFDEGVIGSLADANLGTKDSSTLPPDSGGAIAMIDRIGAAAFVARARALSEQYGERFTPPIRLVELAAKGAPLV